MSPDSPRVESFVLRFVHDAANAERAADSRAWHVVVVHVQSNEEKTFTEFADAVAFVSRYVTVGDFVFKQG